MLRVMPFPPLFVRGGDKGGEQLRKAMQHSMLRSYRHPFAVMVFLLVVTVILWVYPRIAAHVYRNIAKILGIGDMIDIFSLFCME